MTKTSTRTSVNCIGLVGLVFVLGVCACTMQGCRRSLFGTADSQSQFERTDALRGDAQPGYVFDEYGRKRPNLSGKLLR